MSSRYCLSMPRKQDWRSPKDAFYDSLQTVISELPDKEIVIPSGDWNGHVGREAAGYEGVHGGSGYGIRNADGDSP